MSTRNDTAFITGASLSSIQTDIRLGYGWSRTSRDTWEDDEGRRVIYLNEARKLHGCPKGCVVYLAPGYSDRDDWWEIQDVMRVRECEQVDLS